jgi:ATP-binding cassette, subfamily C (CFTR/MRP), member 1
MASQSSAACFLVDKTFGPYATGKCRGGFDFTLLFEEIILSILPITLILVVAPFRIFYLFHKQKKVVQSRGLLLYSKLVCASHHRHLYNISQC